MGEAEGSQEEVSQEAIRKTGSTCFTVFENLLKEHKGIP